MPQAGQSMGRGRGHGSQVGTSGTQRRIYAIVPPIEPADQSIIQGMFMLSLAYGQGYCLIMVHHIH